MGPEASEVKRAVHKEMRRADVCPATQIKKVMSGAGPGVRSLKAAKGEVKGFPWSAGSRVPSAQNIPHAKMVH